MKKLYASLTTPGSIKNLIAYLEDYKVSLNQKCEEFCSRLIDVGIETAKENTGQYANYILFRKEVKGDENGYVGLLIANGKPIVKEWYTNKKKTIKRSYTVDPLLLAEFGSGWLSKNLDNVDGVGQGTMPGQRHAFDENGWWWYDEDGEKHHSIGEVPTFPIHAAFYSMLFEIDRIGREVFKNV